MTLTPTSVAVFLALTWLICCVAGAVTMKSATAKVVITIIAAIVVAAWVTGVLVAVTVR
jgi:hypothetical protein